MNTIEIEHCEAPKISKEQEWQTMREDFTFHVVDGIGTRMDEGVVDTVVALNLLGIPTTASCEGHMDHGTYAPWVDIGADSVLSSSIQSLRQQAMESYQSGDMESALPILENAERLRLMIKMAQKEKLEKLMNLIEEFYDDRETPLDQRLILFIFSDGFVRLESQGAELQELTPDDKKQERLIRFQSEIKTFGEFLKQKFFSE